MEYSKLNNLKKLIKKDLIRKEEYQKLVNKVKKIKYNKLTTDNKSIILKDCNRSFTKYFITDRLELNKYQNRLKILLLKFFSKYYFYYYYQGFNDIASLFIILFSDDRMDKCFVYFDLFIHKYININFLKDKDVFVLEVRDNFNVIKCNIDRSCFNVIEEYFFITESLICSGILTLFIHDFL